MRYRPRLRHGRGAVAGDHPLTGTQLSQPRVLTAPCLRLELLDDVLASGAARLGVEVPADAWRHVEAATALRTLWQMRGIDVGKWQVHSVPGGTSAVETCG